MRTLLLIASRNLIQAPRRTGLLGLAIGLTTMLLVLLMSLSAGLTDNLITSATQLAAGHVNVGGFFKPTPTSASPMVTEKDALRALVEANVPELDYLIERHRGWGKVVSETGSVQAGLTGIDIAAEGRFLEDLRLAPTSAYKEDGDDSTPGDPSRLAEPGTIMIFASQAKRMDVGIGDQITIKTETSAGMTNTVDAEIVAVAADLGFMSSFSVFVPTGLVLDLYQLNPQTTGALWLYLDDIDDATAVMGRLRTVLSDAGYDMRDHDPNPFFFKFEAVQGEDWTGQQLDLTIWRDEVSYVAWIATALDAISLFVVTLLIVVIAVGIMNAMWNAVRQRTFEIGAMRAIGLSRGRVLALFLLESALLGAGGALAGALGGAAVALGLDRAGILLPGEAVQAILLSDRLHLVVTVPSLVGSVIFLTVFTALAALWPSLRAAFLRPVDALRQGK